MATKTLNNHIEISPGIAGGKPRIAGHRITVQDVVILHDRLGKSADEIAFDFSVTLADIYAALTYYYDHSEEIDLSIEDSFSFATAMREEIPSKARRKLNDSKH